MNGCDERFMRRAIALARAALGTTGENPPVGCVIVQDGVIVGEGTTAPGGRPHAEELALAQAGPSARGATAYVTTEPCGQRSKGGRSCADLLAAAGVARVAAALNDASAYAAGRGPKRLRAAGVRFDLGLLADEARPLHAGYRPATEGSSRP